MSNDNMHFYFPLCPLPAIKRNSEDFKKYFTKWTLEESIGKQVDILPEGKCAETKSCKCAARMQFGSDPADWLVVQLQKMSNETFCCHAQYNIDLTAKENYETIKKLFKPAKEEKNEY